MTITAFDARDNLVLAALMPFERERWLPQMELVDLRAGQVLQEAGRPPAHAFFPLGALVSLLLAMEDGRCDEVAVVGREGVVGSTLFLGSGSSVIRAVVQSPGRALRMRADRIQAECAGSATVLRLLLQYTLAQSAEVAQGVACSRHHSVEQRVCRRLLQGLDSQQDGQLAMTQEQISGWLGVRRESVTVEALKLQKAGLIHYARGHITVVDRAGLERRCCECFGAVKEQYQRLRARDMRLELFFPVARADSPRVVARRREGEGAAAADLQRAPRDARSCPGATGPGR